MRSRCVGAGSSCSCAHSCSCRTTSSSPSGACSRCRRRSWHGSRCWSKVACRGRRSVQRLNDLVRLGPPVFALLGKDQPAVGDDVELALFPGDCLRLMRGAILQLGRETRGPAVIAVSDGAVEDLDARHLMTLAMEYVVELPAFGTALDRLFLHLADSVDVQLVVEHTRLERCPLLRQQGIRRGGV